jgi:hypothetical protein
MCFNYSKVVQLFSFFGPENFPFGLRSQGTHPATILKTTKPPSVAGFSEFFSFLRPENFPVSPKDKEFHPDIFFENYQAAICSGVI